MLSAQTELLTEMARPDAEYRAGLTVGELRYQRCVDCQSAIFYPRVICPVCGGHDLEMSLSTGTGTVYSSTAVRQREKPSYSVSLVDLDDGFRMMTSVVDIPAEDVRVGLRVCVAFDTDADGAPRAVFVPEVKA